jgi:tetratricopeptide (TPR) repeat protein
METGDSLMSLISSLETTELNDSSAEITIPANGEENVAATIFSIVGNQRAKFRKKADSTVQSKPLSFDCLVGNAHYSTDEVGELEGFPAPIQVTRLNSTNFQQNAATFSLHKADFRGGGPKSFSFPLAKEILESPRPVSFEEAIDLWEHAIYLHTNLSLEEAGRMYFTILRCTGKELEQAVPRRKLWVNKGLTHLYRGQLVEACFSFHRALLQNGYEPITLFLYATARFDIGSFNESNDAFQRCLPHFGDLAEIDLRDEGMQYKLSRSDVVYNEQLTARYKKGLPIDPDQEILRRVPALMFFYPRLSRPDEPPMVSRWSPDSSEADDEQEQEKSKKTSPNSTKVPRTPTVSTPKSAKSAKSTKSEARSPWKKLATDLLFGKDDAPNDSFYGYSF